jgi:hypothetical protein
VDHKFNLYAAESWVSLSEDEVETISNHSETAGKCQARGGNRRGIDVKSVKGLWKVFFNI